MSEIVWITPAATVPQACSLTNCIQVADIGRDWFRIRSSVHTAGVIAVTGDELRAFVLAVKAGALDEMVDLGRVA